MISKGESPSLHSGGGFMKRFIKNKKGAAMVEVAIVLPILTMIVFGFIYFTIVMKETLVIQTAAREGARNHAVYAEPLEARAVAEDELSRGQVSGAVAIPTFGHEHRGMRVEKDIVLSIPFADIHTFTISREVMIHPAAEATWED